MHPILHILGREVSAYFLCTVIAALTASALALPALHRAGLRTARAAALLGIMCAAFLVGARLWNVAVNPANFAGALKWYSLRLAGLSLYGGLLGAGAALAAVLHLWKKPILPALDAMVVPGGVAFCIARVGCFLNGCCAGRATRCPLGIAFPSKEAAQNLLGGYLPFLSAVRTVHPTQLYELAGAALGLPLILLLVRHFRARQGTAFFLYAAWFSAVRLMVLPLRALSYAGAVKTVIYPLLYLSVILLGVIIPIWQRRRASK